MDIFIAVGIFGVLLFWVFIITKKPAEPTFVENQTKAKRSSGARLSAQRAGGQPESKTAPMKLGGDEAAPLKTTGHAAGRGRPMPEVLAEIRKANAAAMSPFGLPARGLAPQPAGKGGPDRAGSQECAAAEAAHTFANTTRVLSLLQSQSPEWIKL